jgi:hypothetical protein
MGLTCFLQRYTQKERGNYHIQKGINRAAWQIHGEIPMHFEYPDSVQLLLMKPVYLALQKLTENTRT